MVASFTLERSTNSKHTRKREKFEFPYQVIQDALRRNGWRNEGGLCCELCGLNKKELRRNKKSSHFEVHHFLGIDVARQFFPEISLEVLSSLANTEVLCESCHTQREQELDKPHSKRSDFEEIAMYVLSQFQRSNYGRSNV